MNQATDPPARATLRLIGRFRLERPDGLAVDLPSRRARALLAYLAMTPERTASRERLCGLLWSDRAEPQARASLRQCLLELRAALSSAGLDLLGIGRESVTLKVDHIQVDVDRLQEALNGEVDALTHQLGAMAAYRLLDDLDIGGLFAEWRGQARERLDRGIAAEVTTRLAALESRSEWATARALADAYLQRDGLEEGVVAAAIRCDIALGATGAAHRRFQVLENTLARELGVAPSATVRAALSAAPPPLAPRDPAAPAPTLPHTATRADPAEAPPWRSGEQRAALPLPDRPSIAVLPFKNLGGDPEQEYFADAMTDDIVDALARWRWFFVIDRASSFIYKDLDVEDRRVGAELGIRYVLKGSVRRSGAKLRLTAQLVDAADGVHLWSERFDRTVDDVIDVQDEITERVATAIEPAILRGENLRVGRKKLNSFNALDFFYRGMWHFNRMTADDDRMAETHFREAIQRDPELPQGHVGLARVLYSRAVLGASDEPAADLHLSRQAARKAINLDELDALGYFAASGASLYLGDHAAAVEDARRANALNPNFSFGNYRLGQVMIFSGYPEEAIAPLTRSLRMSPYDPQGTLMIETLALAYYQAGDYTRAVEQATAAMAMGHTRANYLLAAGLAMLGRQQEAEAAYAEIQRHTGPRTRVIAAPYNDPKWRDHLRNGYRMAAGLPLH